MDNQIAKKQREEEIPAACPDAGTIEKYEFKILRSNWGIFSNPEKRDEILRREAENGWRFLEKFDDFRIRVYRRRDAHSKTGGIDPYRTNVGVGGIGIGAMIKEKRKYFIAAGLSLVLVVLTTACLNFYVKMDNMRRNVAWERFDTSSKKAEMKLNHEFELKFKNLEEENISPESSARREKALNTEYEKAEDELMIERKYKERELHLEYEKKHNHRILVWLGTTFAGIAVIWLIAIFRKSKLREKRKYFIAYCL